FVVWGIWSGTSFVVDLLRPTLAAISPDLPSRGPYIRFFLISLLMLFIVLYRPMCILREEKVFSLDPDLALSRPRALKRPTQAPDTRPSRSAPPPPGPARALLPPSP